MRRRNLLASAVLTGLAGCSLTDPNDEPTHTPSRTRTETPTRTRTETPTDTETPTETSDIPFEEPTPTGGVSPIETIRPHTIPDSVPFEASVELFEQPTSDRGATINISLQNTDSRSWMIATDGKGLPFTPSFCPGHHLAVDTGSADISNECPVGGSAVPRTAGFERVDPGEAVAGERVLLTGDYAETCFAAGEHPFNNGYALVESRTDDDPEATFDWGFDVIIAE